jgi:hypothetical protein
MSDIQEFLCKPISVIGHRLAVEAARELLDEFASASRSRS